MLAYEDLVRQDHVMVSYPDAVRVDLVEQLHGRQVPDPYRWLEDTSDPATIAWSAAQDDLYAAARATWPRLDGFRARLSELHAVGDVGAPTWRGQRAFVLRRNPDQEHGVLIAIDSDLTEPDGMERVLIDPMAIDPAGTTTLDFYSPSPSGHLLAYGMSEGGTEQAVIRVMDVETGEIVDTPIDRVRHTPIAWLPDDSGFYFVRSLPDGSVDDDDAAMHRRIYLHMLGADPELDELIFGAGVERVTYFHIDISDDGRWLAVSQSRGTDARNDLWLADRHGTGQLVAVQQGVDALAYLTVERDGLAYILTNRDAPRWRLCVADPAKLVGGAGYEAWRTLIPEDPIAVLSSFGILDGTELPRPLLLAVRTRHAIGEVAVHDRETGAPIHDLALPGLGTVSAFSVRHDGVRNDGGRNDVIEARGGHEAWIGYTDFTTPDRILRYDATTGLLDVWAAPDGLVETMVKVRTHHVTYKSYDGTDVRMFVVSAADRGDAPVPTVLYGYGGFNISSQPGYGPSILAWVEAGGVYAVANLRGGGEEGESWHRAGMRESKQNVFDDLHAAADWLVEQGLTTHEQLGIYGGSNGGLLVGAALTQHPEKYGAVVCSAPLIDMIRYEQFGLGANWHGEYGSAAVPAEFEWLLAYSPYHNVHEGVPYPAVAFTVFDGDTRVDPLHGRKLCAALQHATSSDRPILIRREGSVGHSSRAVSKSVDLAGDMLAFFDANLRG